MKKITILFILPQTQQGGAEAQMLYLLKRLDRSVFRVCLGLLYSNKEMQKEYESVQDMEIINFSKKGKLDMSVYMRIARFVKDNHVDIIQSFMGNHHSYLPAIIAGRAFSVGGIRRTFNRSTSAFGMFKEITIPRILTRFRKIIMISNNYTARDTYVRRGYPESDVHVIPNGIEYEIFSKGNRKKILEEFGLEGRFVLGIVSRLIRSKNHLELIRHFPEIKMRRQNTALLIAGDGTYRKELERMTKEAGLERDVIFTGNRKDIPDLLSAMDLFVFPSQHEEGWPNVIGEAMAAGIPVITYPAGDIERIISNNVDGLIVPPPFESFMKEMLDLISDPKRRERLGANAKKTIRDRFSVESMVHGYESIYKSIAKQEKTKKTG